METEGTIDAILLLWFFVGFIGSLGFYYRFRKRRNIYIIAFSVSVLSALLFLTLLGSINNAATAALAMLSFGVMVCSGSAWFLLWALFGRGTTTKTKRTNDKQLHG